MSILDQVEGLLGPEAQAAPTVFANVANNVSGVLAVAATATDTTIAITPGGGALFPNAPFYVSCEFEVMWCVSKSGDSLIVQRGMDGTTATTHAVGQVVEMRNNAGLWKDHSTAINNLETNVANGTALPANVAYTDRTQELTHKTLDLTDPTKANVIIGTVSPDPSQLAYNNILLNGGFDQWSGPTTANIPAGAAGSGSKSAFLAPYWELYSVNDSSISASRDTSQPDPTNPSGYNLLVNVNTVQANDYVEIQQTIDNHRTVNFDGVVGTQFSISSRIKLLTGGVQVAFRFIYTDGSGLIHSDLGPWLTITGSYSSLKREGVVWFPTLGTISARLSICFKGVGQVAMDNAMLINSQLASNYRSTFPAPVPYTPNLLMNGGFENWARGAGPFSTHNVITADNWTMLIGGGTSVVSRETSIVDPNNGQYSVKVVTAGVTTGSFIHQDSATAVSIGLAYKNQVMTFSVRIRTTLVNLVRAFQDDGAGIRTYSQYHTGDDTWQTLNVTVKRSPVSTGGLFGVKIDGNGTTYIDNATLTLGSAPAPYAPPIGYPENVPNNRLGLDVQRNNLLTNGNFMIWQRGGSGFTGHGVYSADRWWLLQFNGTITVSRDINNAEVVGGTCLAAVTTGTNQIIQQSLLDNISKLKGKQISFTVRLKTSVPNSAQIDLTDGVVSNPSGLNVNPGQWETLTCSIIVSPSAVQLDCRILISAPATVYVESACVVVGSPALAVPMHLSDELHRCLRYFEVIGNSGTIPILIGYNGASQPNMINIPYRDIKPVTPTVTKNGTWFVSNCGQPVVNAADVNMVVLASTVTALGVGQAYPTAVGQNITIEANP